MDWEMKNENGLVVKTLPSAHWLQWQEDALVCGCGEREYSWSGITCTKEQPVRKVRRIKHFKNNHFQWSLLACTNLHKYDARHDWLGRDVHIVPEWRVLLSPTLPAARTQKHTLFTFTLPCTRGYEELVCVFLVAFFNREAVPFSLNTFRVDELLCSVAQWDRNKKTSTSSERSSALHALQTHCATDDLHVLPAKWRVDGGDALSSTLVISDGSGRLGRFGWLNCNLIYSPSKLSQSDSD